MEPTTRSTNKERRRQRILQAARTTLARDGFEALTLRTLAKQAGVTVPTVYNLVGSKDDLLRQLIEGLVMRCERALEEVGDGDPIDMAHHVVTTLSSLFEEDEDFCRAALLAGQRLDPAGGMNASLGIWKRSFQIAVRICLDAHASGLLRGDVDPHRIAERAYDSYRIAVIDWLHGAIDARGFVHNALSGFYLCLAADAVPRFRKALTARLATLDSRRTSARSRAPRSETR